MPTRRGNEGLCETDTTVKNSLNIFGKQCLKILRRILKGNFVVEDNQPNAVLNEWSFGAKP